MLYEICIFQLELIYVTDLYLLCSSTVDGPPLIAPIRLCPYSLRHKSYPRANLRGAPNARLVSLTGASRCTHIT